MASCAIKFTVIDTWIQQLDFLFVCLFVCLFVFCLFVCWLVGFCWFLFTAYYFVLNRIQSTTTPVPLFSTRLMSVVSPAPCGRTKDMLALNGPEWPPHVNVHKTVVFIEGATPDRSSSVAPVCVSMGEKIASVYERVSVKVES
jgi:hypothetical protein